jgi:hypothetical protein
MTPKELDALVEDLRDLSFVWDEKKPYEVFELADKAADAITTLQERVRVFLDIMRRTEDGFTPEIEQELMDLAAALNTSEKRDV